MSRRSSSKAQAAGAPAQPVARGGPYRKPRFDLYTWLLLISLAAIIIGIVMLHLETADYGSPPYKDEPTVMRGVDRAAGLAVADPLLTRCRGAAES